MRKISCPAFTGATGVWGICQSSTVCTGPQSLEKRSNQANKAKTPVWAFIVRDPFQSILQSFRLQSYISFQIYTDRLKYTVCSSFFQLRDIVVQAFISSSLGYCESLFLCPSKRSLVVQILDWSGAECCCKASSQVLSKASCKMSTGLFSFILFIILIFYLYFICFFCHLLQSALWPALERCYKNKPYLFIYVQAGLIFQSRDIMSTDATSKFQLFSFDTFKIVHHVRRKTDCLKSQVD